MAVIPFHQGHDFGVLLERWRDLVGAHSSALELTIIHQVEDLPVIAIRNKLAAAEDTEPGFYLSAGVHGDECAPVWALLQWAEENPEIFALHPITLFPCINPWGLIENTRTDQRGIDINRTFDQSTDPLIAAWSKYLGKAKFRHCLCLHEDYDGAGIYLYEIGDRLADPYLKAAGEIIPIDSREEIDGQAIQSGWFHRSARGIEAVVKEHLTEGCPEAIQLIRSHTSHAVTFETPSELDFPTRVECQKRFIISVFETAFLRDNTENI